VRAERIKVALVSGPDSQPTDGIAGLLRKRLGAIALILLGVHSGALLLFLANMIRTGAWVAIAFNAVHWAAEAVYVVLLWGSRPLSLRILRTLEVVLFTMLMVGYAGYICSPFRLGSLPYYAGLLDGSLSTLSAAVAFPGFAVLVIYGTFIPNSGRRCAAIVGNMAVFPLLVTAAFGLASADINSTLLRQFLGQLALLLAFGAAIAIYGSHRIESLRQEALAARQFGQYQLKRLLGAGGMGKVYLAEHLLLRRPCALKVIRPELTGDPEASLRFEREVQAMAALTHPNIVEIFDYGHAADGTFYYVMEYLPGLSLEELVDQNGPLAPERAVHLLRQVCAALEEAHSVGLIHRDIKPSNILTCQRGHHCDVAKLLDFGMARAVGPSQGRRQLGQPFQVPDEGIQPGGFPENDARLKEAGLPGPGAFLLPLTWERMPSGTPLFMSPEQACGWQEVDQRSDIYSLGATAYFVLTGQPPFASGSPTQVLDAHLCQPVRPLTDLRAGLPEDLQRLVLRCLEKDPATRYPDVVSLEKALASCSCADLWTRERAAIWWQQYIAGQGPSSC
jgi:serine/threonine-protein kinase